jgi:flap endonuclease-1
MRALGVPGLDSAGAYEAEALATSLVINGHADYVASEDMVRLTYLLFIWTVC